MPASSVQPFAAFHAVLAGASYAEAARSLGISKSSAQRQVRRLATRLQRIVGVVGVADDSVPTPEQLRCARDAYLEALAHYAAPRRGQPGLELPTPAALERLLANAARHADSRARNVALLLVLFATAVKPAELAGLRVGDYLERNGTVRAESVLRAEVAWNGRARPLYFTSPRMQMALDAYLDERVRRYGRAGDGWRGLAPDAPLFVRHDGQPFGGDAGTERTAMQGLLHTLFEAAGGGMSALSARRGAVCRLHRLGYRDQEIAQVLGLGKPSSVRRLLPPPRLAPIGEAMMELF